MKRIVAIIFEIIINILISLVFLGILGQVLDLTTYEQLVIGALFFICTSAIWLRYDLVQAAQKSEELFKDRANLLKTLGQIELFEGLNPDLREISDGIKILSERYGSKDLFVYWYSQKIHVLQRHIKNTLDTESFDFDQSMTAERSRILSSLKRSKPDVFWAVASCKSIPHFADPDGTAFLRQVDRMVQDGEITEVRRLFLFDDPSELNDVAAKILFLLHVQNKYKAKIIASEDFDVIFKNFGDKTLTRDFGIYGSNFVWETPEQNIMTQIGFMSRNQNRINIYKQLYEEIWATAKPYTIVQPDLEAVITGHRIDEFRTILLSHSNLG